MIDFSCIPRVKEKLPPRVSHSSQILEQMTEPQVKVELNLLTSHASLWSLWTSISSWENLLWFFSPPALLLLPVTGSDRLPSASTRDTQPLLLGGPELSSERFGVDIVTSRLLKRRRINPQTKALLGWFWGNMLLEVEVVTGEKYVEAPHTGSRVAGEHKQLFIQ